MVDLKNQIEWLSHQASYFKKQLKIVTNKDSLQSKIDVYESILDTVSGVYENDTTVIQSFVIPTVLEAKIKIPKGKILGVRCNKNNELCVTVMFDNRKNNISKMFYVIPDGTKMKDISSIGNFHGTFDIGHLVHVFDKLFE